MPVGGPENRPPDAFCLMGGEEPENRPRGALLVHPLAPQKEPGRTVPTGSKNRRGLFAVIHQAEHGQVVEGLHVTHEGIDILPHGAQYIFRRGTG